MSRAGSRKQALQAKIGSHSGIRAAVAAEPNDAGQTHAELWLYGIVGGYWYGFNSKSVGDQLRGLDVDTLTVRLNSPGGDVFEGIAIANLLRNHKATVTVVVDGLAASAASVIAIAGEDVVMSPGSQFMLHDAWTWLSGNAKELRQEADWIDKQSANLAEQYVLKAGGTAAEWRAAMTADPDGTWYTAQESADAGLADRVGTVTAVSAAPEEPDVMFVDSEDGELFDALALYDLQLVHPAARAVWSPRINAAVAKASGGASKPPSASAVGSIETEGGSAVAYSDETIDSLRDKLGVAEDADDATLLAAVDEVLEKATDPAPKATTAATAIPEGMTLVEKDVMDQLKSDAALGRGAADKLAKQERDTAISAAIASGKTTPARKEHWEKSWDADAEGTKTLLDSLEPGLVVPTAEVGHAQGGDAEALAADADYQALFGKDSTEKKGA